MNGGELMVIVIVAICMVASIVKAGVRSSNHHHFRGNGPDNQNQLENQRLRDEVHELKERLKVLERITVDKENSLAKEIESLRDH